jgi:hypothetical protein
MSQPSQAETRKIVAELKVIIMETLQILGDEEKTANDKNVRAKT